MGCDARAPRMLHVRGTVSTVSGIDAAGSEFLRTPSTHSRTDVHACHKRTSSLTVLLEHGEERRRATWQSKHSTQRAPPYTPRSGICPSTRAAPPHPRRTQWPTSPPRTPRSRSALLNSRSRGCVPPLHSFRDASFRRSPLPHRHRICGVVSFSHRHLSIPH